MEDTYIKINYYFTSALFEENEDSSFVTSYHGDVIMVDIETERENKIGKLKMDLLLLSRAGDCGFPLKAVFDIDEDVYQMGKLVYDFEERNYSSAILEFYDDVFLGGDICLIREIEIIEEYRGKGIGTDVIRDIYNRFNARGGLFIIETYPLQFRDSWINNKDERELEWSKKMDYDSLSIDFEKSWYKLKGFCQRSGFDHIDGLDEWMFLNPVNINEKLDVFE